ncbi:hypothetical protein [Methanoculleus sp.]|uniref:hypothetical protein n=1 Tax=Methanoculleus sp. TaxID=90427 RepID=UPI0025FA8044|nr:hypothetical protein [Methanoculleus sp.]MCK9319773.1 hypothetical protein [Methanoculleus sp.]
MNKYFFIFIFLIIGMSNIYATDVCWDAIECDSNQTPSGSIFNYNPELEITCVIKGLSYLSSTEGVVEIEILQPGYNGATLQQQILVTETFINSNGNEIIFMLSRGMSPTYVNCYDVNATTNGELTRISSMKYWSSSFANTWFSTIDPHKDTKIIKTYENLKSDETNWFFYGVSLFMFIIGLLLIFTTVIAYTKRR